MGCGHSKINIYPKRSRNKTNNKKTVTQEKDESEEEETVENEPDECEDVDEGDKKTIKIKPGGGPLLAQKELSTSQQNFFKMLDEKIENGPDYDSSSEAEKAAEAARLTALLKDWETASAGSRSLPATPKKTWRPTNDKFASIRSAEIRLVQQRAYQQPISQSVVHQSYGVNPHINYHPVYNPTQTYHSPPHQSHQSHQSLQTHQNQSHQTHQSHPSHQSHQSHQSNQSVQPHQPIQTLQSHQTLQQSHQPLQQPHQTLHQSHQSVHQSLTYPYQALVSAQSYQQQTQRLYNSPRQSNIPPHSYGVIPNHVYSNGELIQQQVYTHQLQYQQAREYQQYRQAREQQLLIQQRNYQQNNVYQTGDSPVLHRNHFEMA